MSRPRVLITAALLKDFPGSHERLLQDAGFELCFPNPWPHQMTEQQIQKLLPGHQAVLAGSEPYTNAVFAKAPGVKVIARIGVGHDAVDKAAATAHKVAVTIAVGGNQESVAEQAMGMMLAMMKQFRQTHNGLLQGDWLRIVTPAVRGKTLGIVGLGRIGRAMVPRAKAFRMKVIAAEIQPDHAYMKEEGIELVSFETLMRQADVVSLHVPLTPCTHHMIRAETLQWMKPTAYLINTARGKVVHEPDLYHALKRQQIAGAALDVFDHEPMETKDHPLFHLNNVLLTPHTAGTDDQARHDLALLAARSIIELYHGRWPEEQIVNPDVLHSFHWAH